MKETILTLDEIRWVTSGAPIIENENGIFRFYKCTPKQTEAYYALSQGLGDRSLTTSGVRLDVVTDAKSVRFTPTGAGRYSVEMDGMLRRTVDVTDETAGDGVTLLLPTGEHRVTLWFPSHAVGSLSEFALLGGTFFRPYRARLRLLMLGDSITQGWNSGLDTEAYAPRLCRLLDAHSVIQGIGGAFYHHSTFDPAVSFAPSLVTVAYGTNDFGHYNTVEEMAEEARQMLTAVKDTYGRRRIAVILPPPRFDKDQAHMGSFDECRRALADVAKELDLFTVDGYELVPQMEEMYADAVHPNALGFSIMAERLAEILKKQFFFLN